MEDMQKVKERAEKIARDAQAESRSLREPLEAAIIDNKELKRQMSNYDRDKAALAVSISLLLSQGLDRDSQVPEEKTTNTMPGVYRTS